MANFVTYYSLCPIQDKTEFLGISKDFEEGNIIITHPRNTVAVIQLSSQSYIKTWTTSDKFSSKVVYDFKNHQYVGVFSKNFLKCWKEDEINVNKVKKIKFQKIIVDLVQNEEGEPILIYGDESFQPLSTAISTRKEKNNSTIEINNEVNIEDASLRSLSASRKMLTYFIKFAKSKFMNFVLVILESETLKPLGSAKHFTLNRPDQNVQLRAYTVVESSNLPFLMTIWSDKRIFTMSLNPNISSTEGVGNFVSMITVLNVHSPLSLVGISKYCVAIYGANSTQEGSSLILYNTQFKVIKAKQFFKVFFDFSKLWVCPNYILIAMGQNLSVVKYRVSKELLSEMIGSHVTTDYYSQIGRDFINEEDELEESISFYNQQNSLKNKVIENNQLDNEKKKDMEVFADGLTKPYDTFKNFESTLHEACELLTKADIKLVKDCSEEVELNLISNTKDTGFETYEIQLLTKELEQSGSGENEITEKILTVLIELGNYIDICTCLRRYRNISEKMFSKILKFALSEKLDESLELNEINRKNLLNIVISCSVNFESLNIYIRKDLNYDQVLMLIEHLYEIIEDDNFNLEERPETVFSLDMDTIVFKWLALLIDTHFQELALSKCPKVINLLSQLNLFLKKHKETLTKLNDMAAILYNLVDRKLVCKTNKYSKWYSIEQVELY